MPPVLPDLILFDADGTLYDSERLNFHANKITASELHDYELTWEEFDEKVRRGVFGTSEVLEARGFPVDHEHFQATRHKYYADMIVEQLQPMPGLFEFLDWCEAQNIRRAIVSSSRAKTLESSLLTLGLDAWFEFVISRENVGDIVKPDPYPYLLGLETAGVQAERAMAFEDTAKGIASAKAAGLYCIGMRNENNSDEQLAQADHIVTGYSELVK